MFVNVYRLNCLACCTSYKFHTSEKPVSNVYEGNLRIAYALRCIGKEAGAGSVLCATLNLSKLLTMFSKYNEELLVRIEAAAEESRLCS